MGERPGIVSFSNIRARKRSLLKDKTECPRVWSRDKGRPKE